MNHYRILRQAGVPAAARTKLHGVDKGRVGDPVCGQPADLRAVDRVHAGTGRAEVAVESGWQATEGLGTHDVTAVTIGAVPSIVIRVPRGFAVVEAVVEAQH